MDLKFLRNLFKDRTSPKQEKEQAEEESVAYLVKEDVETRFVRLFSQSGGSFLYCENSSDVIAALEQIVAEAQCSLFWCIDQRLQAYLQNLQLTFTTQPCPMQQINFLTCEYLIAHNGSLLLSSDQTDKRKLNEFSSTFVVLARPRQIVENLSSALRKIKQLKKGNIPHNITTIKASSELMLSGEMEVKRIYLLLLE